MRMIKTLLSCLLLLATLPALAAHGLAVGYAPRYGPDFRHFAYVNPAAPKGGSLTLGGAGSFDTLNPFLLKGDPVTGTTLVFETLLESSWDEPLSAYGLLADDVQVAQDGLSVTFRINSRARFSDGQPVDAAAVAASYRALTGPLAKPHYRFYYGDVKGVTVLDRLRLRFDFRQPNRELPLILGQMPVFSPRWGGGKPLDKISLDPLLGSGPYLLERFELGKSVRYRRDPNYWGAHLPVRRGQFNFDTVTWRYYKDHTISLEAFKAGEYDLIHEFSAKQWATAYKGPRFDDGRIVKGTPVDASPAGMQGFGFNLRRPLFQDIRVRRALGLALDFEWSNRMLFYGQYTRSTSYFSNSEMQARGPAQGAELALLEPYRARLPAAVFAAPEPPPSTAPPSSLRQNLRQARELLRQAGWVYRDGALRNQRGEIMRMELLLHSKSFERIAAPWARNLQKLGVQLEYRVVDASLYQKRLQRFDFDITVISFGASISPGNELLGYFDSRAAASEDSQNVLGIADPVIDALLQKVIQAPDRNALIQACRALDRVLLAGHYLVPNWHIGYHRLAWWNRFAQPGTTPLYYVPSVWALQTWWARPVNTGAD